MILRSTDDNVLENRRFELRALESYQGIEDIINRFADAGLRLFDKANRYNYTDDEIHAEFKKMAKVYLAELFMNATDEVMKS